MRTTIPAALYLIFSSCSPIKVSTGNSPSGLPDPFNPKPASESTPGPTPVATPTMLPETGPTATVPASPTPTVTSTPTPEVTREPTPTPTAAPTPGMTSLGGLDASPTGSARVLVLGKCLTSSELGFEASIDGGTWRAFPGAGESLSCADNRDMEAKILVTAPSTTAQVTIAFREPTLDGKAHHPPLTVTLGALGASALEESHLRSRTGAGTARWETGGSAPVVRLSDEAAFDLQNAGVSDTKALVLAPAQDVHFFLAATPAAVSILSRNGTAQPLDDTLAYKLDLSSHLDTASAVAYDSVQNILYVGGSKDNAAKVVGYSLGDLQSGADDVSLGAWDAGSTASLRRGAVEDLEIISSLDAVAVALTPVWSATDANWAVNTSGVQLINRNGTPSLADDTTISTIAEGSPASMGGRRYFDVSYDSVSGLLFTGNVWAAGGLRIVNTQKTAAGNDDTVAIIYDGTGGKPTTAAHGCVSARADWNAHRIYALCAGANGTGSGFLVIDTQGTISADDDLVVAHYDDSTTPALPGNGNNEGSFVIDSDHNIYYVRTSNGVYKIAHQGTATLADDIITKISNADVGWGIRQMALDSGRYLYVPHGGGISVIDTTAPFATGGLVSMPWNHSQVPEGAFVAPQSSEAAPSDQSMPMSLRRVGAAAYWEESMTASASFSDIHAWGGDFTSKTTANGQAQLSLPTASTWYGTWLDSGLEAGHFEAGSTVQAKFRVNTSAAGFQHDIFVDDWTSYSPYSGTVNAWQIVTHLSPVAFANVGFYAYWDSGWQPQDSLEVDYIRVLQANPSLFEAWSAPCLPHCQIPPLTGAYPRFQLGWTLVSQTEDANPGLVRILYAHVP